MEIVKINKKELEKVNQLLNQYKIDLKVGDMFFDLNYQPIIRISKIELVKVWKSNDPNDKEKVDSLEIHFECAENYECTEWESYGSSNIEKFIRDYGNNKLIKPLSEYLEEANKVISGEYSIEEYKDNTDISTQNALVHAKSKEFLTVLQNGLQQKYDHINLVHQAIKFQIEKKKFELEKIREQLGCVLSEFKDKIKKLEEVIWMIELYLGIHELVIQIKEGKKAEQNSVIYFRQEMLYMDEEVGDPWDDGIDFEKIEQFDEWISNNINRILPEEKSVVVFRVRRDEKKYTDNPFINKILNKENKKTYLLIKNGECLYRIWGDIRMANKLFPTKTEFYDIQQEMIENAAKGREYYNDILKNELDNKSIMYQRQLIMIQGLLDRTDVLQPYGEPIKLISSEIHESGRVKFIYDGEIKLPDSKMEFWDWHKMINEGLQEGDRIILSGIGFDYKDVNRFDNRFYGEKYKLPDLPNAGLYQVEIYNEYKKEAEQILNPDFDEHKNESWENKKMIIKKDENRKIVYKEWYEKHLCIKYNPGDTIYNLWDYYGDNNHERKNNLSYKIYEKDIFLLNFDKATIEDIDFYLNSRINRRHYLKMIPMLIKIKELKLQEKEAEKDFVKMMYGELMNKNILEDNIWDAISWWKLKNKWKRSLKSDDSKAYRMIKNYILNKS